MRLIFLDTETTGMNKSGNVCENHRIIEIGCVEMIDGEVTGKEFHRFINPGQKIDKAAYKIHGIKGSNLKGKPAFKNVAEELINFLDGSTIVIHNASFDISFLDKEFMGVSKQIRPVGKTFKVIDTLQMARQAFPGMDNSLKALVQRFGLRQQKLHSAIEDARMLSQIYLFLENVLYEGSF